MQRIVGDDDKDDHRIGMGFHVEIDHGGHFNKKKNDVFDDVVDSPGWDVDSNSIFDDDDAMIVWWYDTGGGGDIDQNLGEAGEGDRRENPGGNGTTIVVDDISADANGA